MFDPASDLPPFEGRTPDGIKLTVTGSIKNAEEQPPRAMRMGETGILVVRYIVRDVNHSEKEDGTVTRQHRIKIVEAHDWDSPEAKDMVDRITAGGAGPAMLGSALRAPGGTAVASDGGVPYVPPDATAIHSDLDD
jgi:hypothetical protein